MAATAHSAPRRLRHRSVAPLITAVTVLSLAALRSLLPSGSGARAAAPRW